VNRRNVSASADDYNACDDFFISVVKCHIVAAAMHYLKMNACDDVPSHQQLPHDLWLELLENRKDILLSVSKELVLCFGSNFINGDNLGDQEEHMDNVQDYATELLSYGLLYMEFSDGIREGDGLRVLRCWRYFMLLFKVHNKRNYSIEALHLLSQYHFYLSHRQAQQLLWSRFINTQNLPGHNIPTDLYMEHLNRICKIAVTNLGANQTPNALKRVGKCVGVLSEVIATYDKEFSVTEKSGKHTAASAKKDNNIILEQLLDANVFSHVDHRSHRHISIKKNVISSINEKLLFKWMKEHINSVHNKMYN
jgi:L1 cell adhesion molecule like protein